MVKGRLYEKTICKLFTGIGGFRPGKDWDIRKERLQRNREY